MFSSSWANSRAAVATTETPARVPVHQRLDQVKQRHTINTVRIVFRVMGVAGVVVAN
jgi:hypothetical protein